MAIETVEGLPGEAMSLRMVGRVKVLVKPVQERSLPLWLRELNAKRDAARFDQVSEGEARRSQGGLF